MMNKRGDTRIPVSWGSWHTLSLLVSLTLLAALLLGPLPLGLAAPVAGGGHVPPDRLASDHRSGDVTALGAGTISISPASATVLVGGTVSVDVWINDVTDLYGMDFRICFDSTLVSVPSNNATLLWEVFDQFNNFIVRNAVYDAYEPYCPCSAIPTHKWYWYSVTQTDDPFNPGYPLPFSGSGRFARLTFQGLTPGTTALHFCYAKGSSKDGAPIWSVPVDGSITVVDGRISDWVWNDLDRDGLQDGGEPGFGGATVRLYDGTGVTLLDTTVTSGGGSYQFTGLSAGSYIVEFVKPADHIFTVLDADGQGLTGPNNSDANRTTGRTSVITLATPPPVTYVDAGIIVLPTLAVVHGLSAYTHDQRVIVQWSTAAELGTLGFHLLRLDGAGGQYVRVNDRLVPALGSPQGGTYRVVDESATPGGTYTYQVVEVEAQGGTRTYGPFTVEACGEGEAFVGDYAATVHAAPAEKTARIQAREVAEEKAALSRAARGQEAKPPAEANVPAGDVSVKIVVTEAGLYKLTASAIAAPLGVSSKQAKVWIKSGQLQLQNQGQDVPYRAAEDHSAIYFCADGIESIYTVENIYWLRCGEALPMETVKGPLRKPASPTQSFQQTLHLEQDRQAVPALFNDPHGDYWMWEVIWSGYPGDDARTFVFRSDGVAAGAATLTLHLLGYSNSPASNHHHVMVSLNGQEVAQGQWDGAAAFDLVFTTDVSLLNDGDNSLQVRGILDEGVPYSAFYVDSFDVTYPRHYRAVNNSLVLRPGGNPVVTVEGFTDSNIWVFDVTAALRPKGVLGTRVQWVEADRYRVTFAPPSPDAVYLAVTPDAARAPLSVFADGPSHLKSRANAADYVVVTPLELKEAAQELADYRSGHGLAAMVVELEDIYDEFNYGISSPAALQAFLSYAYHHWRQAPQYVVLAGEGTYDYKDNLGQGDSLVPVWMVGTPNGLFASDNRFADVSGNDGVPEMAIGRLPVMTPDELRTIIAKIQAYENASGEGWADQVIMLADNADDGGDFAADSHDVAALLPSGYVANTISLSDTPLSSARSSLLEALSSGAVVLNYIGHAGLDRLASEGLLLTADLPALNNSDRLPVAACMTCAVGQYAIPGYDSLGELLLLWQGGGAAAVWGPTGWSLNTPARRLDEAFFRALFEAQERVLGQAVRSALREYAALGEAPFMLDIYNLLGDPALVMK